MSAKFPEIKSRYLFTGDHGGRMKQWSIKRQLLLKDFGEVHENPISSFVATNDGKFLFSCDFRGFQIQWSIPKQKRVKDYDELIEPSDSVDSATLSYDSKYLFLASMNGHLVQISINKKKVKHNFGGVYDLTPGNCGIHLVEVSYDSKYLFVCNWQGSLKQFCIKKNELVKDYGQIHKLRIKKIVFSDDNQFFYTRDQKGSISKWGVETHQQEYLENEDQVPLIQQTNMICLQKRDQLENFVRQSQIINTHGVNTITITQDCKQIFSGSGYGDMQQWCPFRTKIIKAYSQIHSYKIFAMEVSI